MVFHVRADRDIRGGPKPTFATAAGQGASLPSFVATDEISGEALIDKRKLRVGSLADSVTEKDLKALFQPYGRLITGTCIFAAQCHAI